ncbi:MAG: sugar ABC transporter ATP-binding protein [Firmicutes bacterium]|nr:sugar ABC transporter ATP-binding protein [Bacillota bacterium]
MNDDILLKAVNIFKSFPGVKALDGVSLTLRKGTIHALCGENGAGKSTLMNILIGLYRKDSGHLFYKGKEVDFSHPKQALDLGISIIEQELAPIYDMTVAENIFLGREPITSGKLIDYPLLNKMAAELLADLDVRIDPTRKMRFLSLAEIQLVEIAKAISRDSDVIIMDEPTSAIGEKEVDNLFKVIRRMKDKGKGIIYVSHKLKEIFAISDEVTILRDGKYIATKSIENITPEELITLMLGRKIQDQFIKDSSPQGTTLLSVNGFSKHGQFHDISFNLKKGEVLGVFGRKGSGRTEFLRTLVGLEKPDKGEVAIEDRKVKISSPRDALKLGIAFVPEDRKEEGLVLTRSVKENLSLSALERFITGMFINDKKEKMRVMDIIEKFDIKTPGLEQIVKYLSGGNQQKVAIARCILTGPKILLLDEPTRGIDVGAKREIYKFIVEYVKEGNAVVMVSSEIPEILGVSDRIVIFRQGTIVGELSKKDATQEDLLRLAL